MIKIMISGIGNDISSVTLFNTLKSIQKLLDPSFLPIRTTGNEYGYLDLCMIHVPTSNISLITLFPSRNCVFYY